MKVLLITLILFPLRLFSQDDPICISVNNSPSYGLYYNSFAKRFLEPSHIFVRVTNTAFYHKRKIKKVELSGSQSGLFWSVDFDTSGKIVLESIKGEDFLMSKQHVADSIHHTDTLILRYYRLSKMMRIDTIITRLFQYKHADTVMSFTRKFTTTWFNGELMNEQNQYYNEKFLNKRIKRQGIALYGKYYNPKGDIHLRKKLKTNYDSSIMYSYTRENRDLEFYANFGQRSLEIINLTKHPFVKMYGSSNFTKCMTPGACFNEPVYHYESMMCGMGLSRAQEREQKVYGYTSGADGLFDTYYCDTYIQRGMEIDGEYRHVGSYDRSTILYFKYTRF